MRSENKVVDRLEIVERAQSLLKNLSQIILNFLLISTPPVLAGVALVLTFWLLPMCTFIETVSGYFINFLASISIFLIFVAPVYLYGVFLIRALKKLPKNVLGLLVVIGVFSGSDKSYIPIYFFQGVDDYQTSYNLTNEFFEHLKAPQKKMIRFENSAHSPMSDESEKFYKELIDLK